jgi:hypothetical protein
MRIPGNQPSKHNQSNIQPKGDVSRELLSTKESTESAVHDRFQTPKLPENTGKNYFKNVKAKRLPPAGKVHLAAIHTFHERARKQHFKHRP